MSPIKMTHEHIVHVDVHRTRTTVDETTRKINSGPWTFCELQNEKSTIRWLIYTHLLVIREYLCADCAPSHSVWLISISLGADRIIVWYISYQRCHCWQHCCVLFIWGNKRRFVIAGSSYSICLETSDQSIIIMNDPKAIGEMKLIPMP